MTTPFLQAEWRDLIMLNYEIEPAVLRPLVPAGTELDSWQGHTYLSVVGFRFERTRLRGLAIPFHQNFPEVNLRYYVRRQAAGEVRRAVVFIKEVVPRAAIALVARLFYNEKYVTLPMRNAPVDGQSGRIAYGWRFRGRWQSVSAEVNGDPSYPAAGSQEEFITEHYWGYSALRNGRALEYRVEHPPWRVWPAGRPELDCDVSRFYGLAFAGALQGPPASAFVADGSAVAVYKGSLVS